MSETYQSKQGRRQRLLEALPAGLRAHVSIRNIGAVAALPVQAQARLVEALQAGLKRLPRAVEQLRNNPNTSVAELLDPPAQFEPKPDIPNHDVPQYVKNEVADLIQQCFPDMPRLSAEALVEAEVMEIVQHVAEAHYLLFKSNQLGTDFVVMVLYGLMRQTVERLEELIEQTPALRQAFEQGDLPWKPNEWRKQNA
jgi:hypothetical protein